MIKVKRTISPKVLELNESPKSIGEIETADAITFFSIPANYNLPFKKLGKNGAITKQSYNVYSDKTVRKALKKMLNGKCAYCESNITSIYNGDIEHFRPKGGYVMNGALNKPGYFWLASEWENLLFACPFCNQTNTHEINENGKLKEIVLGKLNQFPLLTEKFRLKPTDGLRYLNNYSLYQRAFAKEESERLLLKPCTDEVEKHFIYDDNGTILPNHNLTTLEIARAEASIKVYALQRLDLVRSREEKIIKIKAQIRRVEEAILNYSNYFENSEEERTWFEGILRNEFIELKSFTNPDQEYAGLAKYVITEYLNKFTGKDDRQIS